MTDRIRVFAGECTADFEGSRDRTARGIAVALVKPDNTVLVHDSDGYSPVAWLTRPASLAIEQSDDTTIEANDGDQHLHVRFHELYGVVAYPGSVAGAPVGTCSETESALVRNRGSVVNIETSAEYGIPTGAVVLDERCDDCGLPLIRVERGKCFEVCLDRECEPLEATVIAAFDRAWSCPECGDDLRVLQRGGLIVQCDSYSEDCETEFVFPSGTVVGTCECGLPMFETETEEKAEAQGDIPCRHVPCDRAG